jgi:hypothetical protein
LQYDPAVQFTYIDKPVLGAKAPAGLRLGDALRYGQYEPAGHAPDPLEEEDPVGQEYPREHGPDTAARPVRLQKYPAVHAIAADSADDGQYDPTGHTVSLLLPDGQYVVALHVT